MFQMKKFFSLFHVNSPVVLGFTGLCLFALGFSAVTMGLSNDLFFSVYRSSPKDPLTYFRLFSHVFGHADLSHFMGNMTVFLIVGPLLEEKYKSKALMIMIATTALVTGLVHIIFFPGIQLLGASGVVFAMILASSFTSAKDGKIPLTFVLVSAIYLGDEILSAFFVEDNISQLSHILGGIVGAMMGGLWGKV